MTILRRVLLLIVALALLLVAWLWWNRPQKVDLAAYAPADSLIYLESNSLPGIVEGILTTDAWTALEPFADFNPHLGKVNWLSRIAALTGIGSAESVVLARAQIAIVVTGFDIDETGDSLKVKPRAALVAVTHTSESRTIAAVEKRVGDFARSALGTPSVGRQDVGGAVLTTWVVPDAQRRIITVVDNDLVVIGNEESTVRACLAVGRGERPNLAGDAQLQEMRRRMDGDGSLAFGYVSPTGAQTLLEVMATAYAAKISADPRAQSAAASVLPQLAGRIFGATGWSSRISGGAVEDRYFVSLQNEAADRLRGALRPAPDARLKAVELLPSETHSVTRYNYDEPEAAWRGLNATLSSQLDTLGAIFVTRLLEAALEPYGIADPETFLRSIGSEIITARLGDDGESTVTIVEARDGKALRDFATKLIGPGARRERVGEYEMLVSRNEERGAVSFVAGFLMIGSIDSVRRCLSLRAQAGSLILDEPFRKAARLISNDGPANIVTLTSDVRPARNFFNFLADQWGVRERSVNRAGFDGALGRLAYSVSETRLTEGGFEKTTRSSFGQFGTIATELTARLTAGPER